uniref:Ig-like domain-containing protein n=1 Tax=Hucho hucho TaxID=62062 RepID=A0A4W5PFK3_9TELE
KSNFSLMLDFVLCVSGLVSVLVFQCQTMEVRTGDTITLQCSNVTAAVGHTAWFKQVNGSEPVCISSMYSMNHSEMFSNNTTIFLKITKVEIADCGLYFCGLYPHSHMFFVNRTVYLDDKGTMYLLPLVVILGVVTAVLLIVILILVLKIRRDTNIHNTGRIPLHDNIGSVNYTSSRDVFPMTSIRRVSGFTRME